MLPSMKSVYNHGIYKLNIIYDKYNIDLIDIFKKHYKSDAVYHDFMHAMSTLYFTDMLYRFFYKKLKSINKDALLIAAFCHDIGYNTQNIGADYYNIRNTIIIIEKYLYKANKYSLFADIMKYIKMTEYPQHYVTLKNKTDKLIASIIRAADLSQIFIYDIDVVGMFKDLYCIEMKKIYKSISKLIFDNINFYKNAKKDNKIFRIIFKKFLKELEK